jgi:hypothetical protein
MLQPAVVLAGDQLADRLAPGTPPCSARPTTAAVCLSRTTSRATRSRARGEQGEELLGDHAEGGWAAGDAKVDGQNLVERRGVLGPGAEAAVAECAVAEGGDEAWFGHRVVGGAQRTGHAGGDGAGDEQDVGVAG